MNAPDIIEQVFLQDHERKVIIVSKPKVEHGAIFYFAKEDHTVGNALRALLVADKSVIFAGYRLPHPLQTVLEVRVQTDGQITPVAAVINNLAQLEREFQELDNMFTKAKNDFEAKSIAE